MGYKTKNDGKRKSRLLTLLYIHFSRYNIYSKNNCRKSMWNKRKLLRLRFLKITKVTMKEKNNRKLSLRASEMTRRHDQRHAFHLWLFKNFFTIFVLWSSNSEMNFISRDSQIFLFGLWYRPTISWRHTILVLLFKVISKRIMHERSSFATTVVPDFETRQPRD